jgi:hypothetical protein
MKDDLSAKLSEITTMGSPNRRAHCTPRWVSWTVHVRDKADHFKFAWTRPRFRDPKIWEQGKHKNDRNVPWEGQVAVVGSE